MNRGAVAGTLAVLYAGCAWELPLWIGWLPAWLALVAGWVALVYGVERPRLLGKVDAPGIAGVLLYPLLGSARMLVGRPGAGRAGRSEVAPGLWVGGWPAAGPDSLAHLDCTAELPRRAEPRAYRCVPMLDGTAMSPEALHEAVEQVMRWRAEGLPVLVHCAYGQGRSVAVTAAVMVRSGLAPTLDDALDQIRALRPRARLVRGQRAVVEAELARGGATRVGVVPRRLR